MKTKLNKFRETIYFQVDLIFKISKVKKTTRSSMKEQAEKNKNEFLLKLEVGQYFKSA